MNQSEKDDPSPLSETDDKTGMFLLDEASSMVTPIAPELEEQKRIASDISRPITERIEAFEDIFDSEVGDTSLSRARNIEREVGFRQIFVKFEGGNPTGTQKDRIAFSQVRDALRRGFDSVTMATCGNYGVAMAFASSLAGIKCDVFIPDNYHTKRAQEMINFGANIQRIEGDYEKAVEYSREYAYNKETYDANPGGANTVLQLRAYGEIANEIYDELRDAPGYIAVPVSNGTTLAGIYKGFLSLYRRGKTSRIPKIIASSSYGKNPIVNAFLKNTPTCSDLAPEKIRETAVNEPLINWQSIDGDLALEAVRTTGGIAGYASDKAMMFYAKFIREREGLNVLPASAVGLITLLEIQKKANLGNDRYVVILTGRKT